MNIRKFINNYTAIVALICVGILPQPTTYAAPLLTDTPLFLKNTAESNVFFLLDTSGSMRLEMMTPEDCGSYGGCYCLDRSTTTSCTTSNIGAYIYKNGISSAGNSVVIKTETNATRKVADFDQWATRSYDYNKMYYNPARTYESWPGTAYPDADPTSARVHVDSTTNLNTVDLTKRWKFEGQTCTTPGPTDEPDLPCISPLHYYTWTDDGDSLPEATEGTLVPITDSDEQKNFANWFVYHRNRHLSSKFALGKTVTDIPFGTRIRVGYEILHDTDNTHRQEMTSITAATTADAGYARMETFRQNIYRNAFKSGTHTRKAYARAASYFACDGKQTPFPSGACALQKSTPTGVTGATPTDLKAPAECQQNFMVVMTDGAYNGSFPATHSGKSTADNDLGGSNTAFDADSLGHPYRSATSSTLADLAMYYYETDLDTTTGIGNEVITQCGVDENAAQHLVTYGLSFGIPSTVIAPTAHPEGMDPACTPTVSVDGPGTDSGSGWEWLDGTSTATQKTNDFVHATYNGRGKFYNATNPETLLDGLQDAISDAASRTGASAGIGISSTTNSGGTVAYLAKFKSVDWFGSLSAFPISTAGVVSSTAAWEAHSTTKGFLNYDDTAEATAADKVHNNRTIVTYNLVTKTATAFNWASFGTSFSDDQKDDLRTDSTGAIPATPDAIAQERLNYIRGDHSCESSKKLTTLGACTTTGFRSRQNDDATPIDTRLGDIVNSTPVYVGKPVANYPNTRPFPEASPYRAYKEGSDMSAFATTNAKDRTAVLYVGANDGMLHAFNAGSSTPAGTYAPVDPGNEIFAYIPGALYNTGSTSGLHKLTEKNGHISYVDLTPTIADVFVDDPVTPATDRKWRTVLVGGLRNGGKGIYALDVTDPDYIKDGTSTTDRETKAVSKVMWEFTDADDDYNSDGTADGDLGYTYSQPVIVPMRVASTGDPIEAASVSHDIEWFVVFGNGYNSAKEHSVLYLLKLAGPGSDGKWDPYTDYYKIDTGIGGPSASNGLSSPAVIDTDGDKIFDRIYAGDLQGRMWAFDVSLPASTTNWVVDGGQPLLVAYSDLAGTIEQPITVKPTVARNVRVTGTAADAAFPNVMVMFGTGSYIADGDEISTQTQTFYGVYDDGTPSELDRTTTKDGGEFALVPQNILTSTAPSGTEVRAMNSASTYDVDYASAGDYAAHIDHQHGWYIDLPESRERVTSKAALVGNTLFFSTITPNNAPCDAGGTSWLMGVSPMDGHSPGILTFDTDGDSTIDSDDIISAFSGVDTITAGVRSSDMIPQYSFLSRDPATPGPDPCSSGSAVHGIGVSTGGTTTSSSLCTGGGSGKAGRYSWRQLNF